MTRKRYFTKSGRMEVRKVTKTYRGVSYEVKRPFLVARDIPFGVFSHISVRTYGDALAGLERAEAIIASRAPEGCLGLIESAPNDADTNTVAGYKEALTWLRYAMQQACRIIDGKDEKTSRDIAAWNALGAAETGRAA